MDSVHMGEKRIMEFPTIDVILHYEGNDNETGAEVMMLKELIYCKDCRHRLKNHTCLRTMKRKPDDGYCDEGEKDEGSVLAKYMAV